MRNALVFLNQRMKKLSQIVVLVILCSFCVCSQDFKMIDSLREQAANKRSEILGLREYFANGNERIKQAQKELGEIQTKLDNLIQQAKQDLRCPSQISYITDRMTKKSSNVANQKLILKGFSILLFKDVGNDFITLAYQYNHLQYGCIGHNSEINALFKDKTILTLLNDNEFSCGGLAFTKLHSLDEEGWLNNLTERKLQAIRLNTMTDVIESDSTETQSNLFQRQIKCLRLD